MTNILEVKKRAVVTIVCCVMAVLSVWIWLAPVENCLPFYEVNRRYLDETTAQALKSMGCVALIKGVADVVEGSSITAGAVVVQGTVEAGDMAQPVLDVVTVIWNVMLVVAAYLSVLFLIGSIAPTALKIVAIGYLCLFCFMFVAGILCWRFRKDGFRISMSRLMRLLCVIILFVQFVLPLTLRVSAWVSQRAIAPMRAQYDGELDKLKKEYTGVSMQLKNSKAVIGEAAFWQEVWFLFKRSAQGLSRYACFAFAMWFVEGLLIPLCALLFNVWLVKQYVIPCLDINRREKTPLPPKETEDEHE